MKLRTLKPLKSDFRPDVSYPAGSEVAVLEPLDEQRAIWLVEVRIPDPSLAGGASYDVTKANLADLSLDLSDATEFLANEDASATGKLDQDVIAAQRASMRDVSLDKGATRAPRELSRPQPGL
jgi:hypothetical protein